MSGIGFGTTLGAQRDYDPGTPGPSCIGVNAWGPDVAYRLDLVAGDVADLTYTAWNADGAVYIVTDCSRVSQTCVAGADNTLYAQPEYIHYTAPTAGVYYLILDGDYQYLAGAYDLSYSITCSSAGAPEPTLPATEILGSGGPNPFRQSTVVQYSLARPGRVQIEVFNAAGRSVRKLMDAEVSAGPGHVSWDGRDSMGRMVSSGAYFCRLHTEGGARTEVLVKTE